MIILVFLGLGQWPGARRLGPGLKYDNCVAGRAWTYFLRAGSGPHNSVCGLGLHNCCGPGPGPEITFAGRAWAYISGQGPNVDR